MRDALDRAWATLLAELPNVGPDVAATVFRNRPLIEAAALAARSEPGAEGLARLYAIRDAAGMLVDAYGDNSARGTERMGRAYLALVAALTAAEPDDDRAALAETEPTP